MNMRDIMRLVETNDGELYHGSSLGGLLLIVTEDRMLAIWDMLRNDGQPMNGVSLTRSFAMAKTFAIRAHDNAVQYAYGADPTPKMLPWVAERNVAGESGAIIIFDRAALVQSFTPQRLFQVSAEWSDRDDEQEERLLNDTDFLHDIVRHIKRIVIIDPQRYRTFKSFILHHQRSYTATFAKIEQLAG